MQLRASFSTLRSRSVLASKPRVFQQTPWLASTSPGRPRRAVLPTASFPVSSTSHDSVECSARKEAADPLQKNESRVRCSGIVAAQMNTLK